MQSIPPTVVSSVLTGFRSPCAGMNVSFNSTTMGQDKATILSLLTNPLVLDTRTEQQIRAFNKMMGSNKQAMNSEYSGMFGLQVCTHTHTHTDTHVDDHVSVVCVCWLRIGGGIFEGFVSQSHRWRG